MENKEIKFVTHAIGGNGGPRESLLWPTLKHIDHHHCQNDNGIGNVLKYISPLSAAGDKLYTKFSCWVLLGPWPWSSNIFSRLSIIITECACVYVFNSLLQLASTKPCHFTFPFSLQIAFFFLFNSIKRIKFNDHQVNVLTWWPVFHYYWQFLF